MRWKTKAAAAAVAAVALASCGGGSTTSRTTIHVFAAASLTEAYTAMASRFERDHPRVQVATTFAASSALAQQIVDGADADVFASADDTTMKTASAARKVRDPHAIAGNRLAVVVGKGNPRHVQALRDLADPTLTLVLCAPQVPCGRYAQLALRKGNVDVRPRSLEENVKGVVAKVQLGEADAGIVYATDARSAAAAVEEVDVGLGGDPELVARYFEAVTTSTKHGAQARAWDEYVDSEAGRAALVAFGFLAP